MKLTDLYNKRLENSRHHGAMWLDPACWDKLDAEDTRNFMKEGPYRTLSLICGRFNAIAEKQTKGKEYNVLRNIELMAVAADLHYQYKRLKRWAEGKGCTDDLKEELDVNGVTDLYKHIRLKAPSGQLAFESKKLLKVLPEINKGSAVAVLLYMKARCNQPTGVNGVTELQDKTIAEGLGIKRKTVYRARKVLEEQGVIEEIIKNTVEENGKFKTYSKYLIKI